ncbi:fimbrial protein [Burkholderia vietnamiensis]|uniref:fimbrial protein n=1 Tax=Burkholderia vietnamiensis TaxID=60552 RepID=UPI000D784DDB|nr:fimbrial protein [Burkholderia vietnamiensis]GBH26999.1 serotype 2 fimbrial subunit [Burkholderia vietnamiensis]
MKNIAFAMSLFGLACAAANTAHAADGTVNFTGSIVASTCQIEPGTNNQVVNLPRVSTSQLGSVGATVGRTPFVFLVSGCEMNAEGGDTSAPAKKVSVAFEPGPNVDLSTGRLNLTGADAAGGVQIQILNDKYEPILVGAPASEQRTQTVNVNTDSGRAALVFSAQYIATGATVTGGSANSYVTYSLVYP